MNVLIKRLAIGGVLYAVAEASFLMGKGFMLGILKGYDVSALYFSRRRKWNTYIRK